MASPAEGGGPPGDTGGLLAKVWSPDAVLDQIQRFTAAHGRPPRVIDWNPSVARRRGRDELAQRFHDEGCWPHANTVRRLFGSWRRALDEAGHPTVPTGGASARQAWLADGLVSTTDIAEMAGVNRFDVRRPLARSGLQPAEVRGRIALYRRDEAAEFARRLRVAIDERTTARRTRAARATSR